MTRRRCAVRWPARGASRGAERRRGRRRAGGGARASVLRRWRTRPASNTTSTHPWDRRTSRRASLTSTTSAHRGNRAGLHFPSHVILRPVFFMENLLAPFSLQGSTLAWALGQRTKVQMIAVDDIGWFGARAFTDAAALNRREIDLAGDVRTMPAAAEILKEALGRPIAFAQTPIEQVQQHSKDMALMLEWFERVGYSADIPAWNASSAARSPSSPTGRAATGDQWALKRENPLLTLRQHGVCFAWGQGLWLGGVSRAEH